MRVSIFTIDDDCTPKTITVLGRQMGVVPEAKKTTKYNRSIEEASHLLSGLPSRGEVVDESSIRWNRTLIHESGTVHIGSPGLEESMPMLLKV